MANSIALFKNYVTLLDEVYKAASLTSVLDGAAELAAQGANANELIIPKLSMEGLANYSRSSGYADGSVTMTNETVVCNFDRGRMFTVDNMDNAESAGIAFGRLSGEFIRTRVVPELDAFRLAAYAGTPGISTADAAALSNGAAVVSALREAVEALDEKEVPAENRFLFITPTLKGMLDDMDTTKSRKVLEGLNVVKVPQSRMYTKITQYDGTTDGQTEGGYVKDAADGRNINFLLIQKDAVIQFQKHIAPKIITPENNQTADAWKFGYRNVGIADVYANKVSGIYLHTSTT